MNTPARVRSNDKVIVMYDSNFHSSIAYFIESDGVFYMDIYEYPDEVSPRLKVSFSVQSYEFRHQLARLNKMTHRSTDDKPFEGCNVKL